MSSSVYLPVIDVRTSLHLCLSVTLSLQCVLRVLYLSKPRCHSNWAEPTKMAMETLMLECLGSIRFYERKFLIYTVNHSNICTCNVSRRCVEGVFGRVEIASSKSADIRVYVFAFWRIKPPSTAGLFLIHDAIFWSPQGRICNDM
jgi:hypothetical protein